MGTRARPDRRRVPPRLGLGSTRRVAVLAIVVCALALTVAVPLRTYLSQRSEIAQQQQRQEQLRGQIAALDRRNRQLQDPEQVEAEARKRLRYVKPGETPYLVQLPEDTPQPPRRAPASRAPQGTWYDNLLDSLGR